MNDKKINVLNVNLNTSAIDNILEQAMMNTACEINSLCAQFMKETGLKASECELVQAISMPSMDIIWSVRKKEPLPDFSVEVNGLNPADALEEFLKPESEYEYLFNAWSLRNFIDDFRKFCNEKYFKKGENHV